MNFPIWDLPGRGLLIAGIAILHVFISHFAVGGGLFLVVTERRARRSRDDAQLAWVKQLSRFFVLLTLVLGAITGVGIWFTIGLVHPDATATLISMFVWVWAIEWTFFVAEIAAALVYYYGWTRLSPAAHLRVGWIYFWNAWLSLVVINGILTFMLTPGEWVQTGNIGDAFFNPTYWPSLVVRTLGAIALAGLYALLTLSWSRHAESRPRLVRYAALAWTVPALVTLPFALWWWLAAADRGGIPLANLFGSSDATPLGLLSVLFGPPASGYPPVRAAALAFVLATTVALLLVLLFSRRPGWLRPPAAAVLMLAGFVAVGGAEWVREGLRKPWVIGQVMFSNGVRLPLPESGPRTPDAAGLRHAASVFDVDTLQARGLLATAHFVGSPTIPPHDDVESVLRDGERVHRALCTSCHTLDGYLALRPLVLGRSPDTLEGVLSRLASPVDVHGRAATWRDPGLRLATWRDRQMPPFAGDARDKRALAVYLAWVGGASRESLAAPPASASGTVEQYFADNCSMCHGDDGEWAFRALPRRTADEYADLLGRLPSINELMPAFEGSDAERRALADYLAGLPRQ